jgi:hypothetical protein
MKKVLVALSCASVLAVASPAPAFAQTDPPCDGILCIRHCNTYHRGLVDRVMCLITHNLADVS